MSYVRWRQSRSFKILSPASFLVDFVRVILGFFVCFFPFYSCLHSPFDFCCYYGIFCDVKAAKKKCCVPGCKIKTGSFFGFPNPQQQPQFFETWLDLVPNPLFKNLQPKDIFAKYRICATHFREEDLQPRGRRGIVWNAIPQFNLPATIPSMYLQTPKLEDSEAGVDIAAETSAEWNKDLTLELEENQLEQYKHFLENHQFKKSDSLKESGSLIITHKEKVKTSEKVKDRNHVLIKVESVPGSSAVNTMTNLKFGTKLETQNMSGNVIDTPVSLSDIKRRCRLCLETSLPLFAFESEVTFDDGSTLDVYQAFQKVTRESDEQMQNEKYPAHLCMSCLKLLVSANNFHEKYQKSLTIIEEMLGQPSEMFAEDFDVPEKIDIAELKLEDAKNNQVELLHKCPICRESFTALDLKKHCWEHSELKSYLHAAPKYNRKVKFFAKPRSTVSIFNMDNPSFTCPFCPEELNTNTYFEHLGEHEKLGNFKCQVCDRTFAAKNRLFVHQRSHKGEETYQCPKSGCSKRFFKKESFDYHTAKHTDLDDLPFRCSACSKAFANPQDLKRHILNHENSADEKQEYFCSTCRKTFGTRYDFRLHPCYKKQLRSKSLVLCYVCGKRVLNIHQHMKSHTDGSVKQKERTYMCSHCGKLFGHMSNLCKHVKCLHTNEATNYCQYCSKEFNGANELKMHECTNSAVRRFVCDLCDKRFTERGYLTRHRKSVHPELFYGEEAIDLDS